jgi:hypothetical protein
MSRIWIACGLLWVLGGAPGALAQQSDVERAHEEEIEELKRQLSIVVDEVGRLRTELAVPEEVDPTLSIHGLGPAASKVYGVPGGISIGGYAEGVYRNRSNDAPGGGEDFSDFIRAVLYVGYKYNDWIVFNTEIEFEHASTSKEGSVSLEFAALDFLLDPRLNARAGLLLLPMGFLNEVHEPPFYFGTQRPEPERQIIPTTWRENGMGIFGDLTERASYRLYVVNGFDASGYSASGLRGGRQKGSEARAEDLAVVARLDYDLFDDLQVGGSYYTGNSGQDQRLAVTGAKLPNARTSIWELHSDYRRGPFSLRALWTQARVGDAAELSTLLTAENASNTVIAKRMIGGYAEVGYDIMQLLRPGSEKALIPFFRFEYLDTQNDVASGFMRDRTKARRLFIPGIQYKPIPQVVLKLDYRNIDPLEGNSFDEISLGMGLVF